MSNLMQIAQPESGIPAMLIDPSGRIHAIDGKLVGSRHGLPKKIRYEDGCVFLIEYLIELGFRVESEASWNLWMTQLLGSSR